MARTCLTIILAAGEGSRMRSTMPKVLHEVAGLSLLGHVMRAAQGPGGDHQVVVVGREAERVEAEARVNAPEVAIAHQLERLGTAHAVMAARDAIEQGFDDILVLFGDTPLIRPETLGKMRDALADGAAVAVLGFRTSEPDGYGRLILEDGELVAIREHKDASVEELKIDFCNGGIMALAGSSVLEIIGEIGNENAKGEYYLTDCVAIARARGLKVLALEAEAEEVHGVNDRSELARIEAVWQGRRRLEAMRSGVTMLAPDTVYFSYDTEVEADAVVEPQCFFGPGVHIAAGARVRAFSHLEGVEVGEDCIVGPYARLRPGTVLASEARVGNFCETKNAKIGEGAKINHLSYIGDATIGPHANIGAGTITCNYDGMNKHLTEIGADAFIGSNSALVAPVSIGDGAYVGSGSVITEAVPDNALAVARSRQAIKPGYAEEIRKRNAAEKERREQNKG